jgi:hypothetical protein
LAKKARAMRIGERAHTDGSPERLVAARTLGVTHDEAAEVVRTAFLRRLREQKFFPDREDAEAFAVLVGRPVPRSRLLEVAETRKWAELSAQVEAFATAFFSLGPSERQTRWAQLKGACRGHKGLDRRLQGLERGLALGPDDGRDSVPDVERIAAHCRELFVLAPRARAIRRQGLLDELRIAPPGEARRWSAAAKALQKRHRATAALAPEFLDGLRTTRRSRPRRPPPVRFDRVLRTPLERKGWPIIVFVALVVLAGRLAERTGSRVDATGRSSPSAGPAVAWGDFRVSSRYSVIRERLQRELAAMGWRADEQVVDDVVAEFAGDRLIALPFLGTEAQVKAEFVHDRERLGDALQKHGIVLDTDALEHLMRTCVNRTYLVAPDPHDGVGDRRQQTHVRGVQ